MARTGITYDEVARAATALLARGDNPTIQRVREMLGSGSNTTLSNHLRHWHSQRQGEDEPVLPPSLPEALLPALETFWQLAVEHAREVFSEERAAALAQVAAAQEAQTKAEAKTDRLAGERDQLQSELDRTTRQLAEREQQLATERSTHQQTAGDLRAVSERRAALEEALQQLRTTLAAAEQRRREERTTLATQYQAQLSEERQRAEAVSHRLQQRLDSERAQARTEREQLLATQAKAREQWESELAAREQAWHKQRQALEQTSARERDKCNGTEREAAELRGRLAQQSATSANLESALQRQHERELALGRDNGRLQATIRQLEGELNRLQTALEQARQAASPEPPVTSDPAA